MQKFPINVEFPVHWGEMDALGHVNHTRHLVWMESARIELFHRVGLLTEEQPKEGPILANLNVNYMRPVHHPSRISVGAGISKIGRTSFVIDYGVFLADEPEKPVAAGSSVIVLVNYQSGEKIPISETMREAFKSLFLSS